jgi:endonuclease YncB( thermonuclease family)
MKIILTLVLSIYLLNAKGFLKDIKFYNIEIKDNISIIDGDTFRININNYPSIVGYNINIKIYGVTTPSIKGTCLKERKLAEAARYHTFTLLNNAKVITLKNVNKENDFSIEADVYADDINIARSLIKNNIAIRYAGIFGSRDWCKN